MMDRVRYGYDAIRAGTPDFGRNGGNDEGTRTDAVDTVANILHLHYLFSLDAREEWALSALGTAAMHFRAEVRGYE